MWSRRWLILSERITTKQPKRDNAQVKTSLQGVVCLVGVWLNIWDKYKLLFSYLMQENKEPYKVNDHFKCYKTVIKRLKFVLRISHNGRLVITPAGMVTAAPAACCTRATNHPGETNPRGSCASSSSSSSSYHTQSHREAKLHSLHWPWHKQTHDWYRWHVQWQVWQPWI